MPTLCQLCYLAMVVAIVGVMVYTKNVAKVSIEARPLQQQKQQPEKEEDEEKEVKEEMEQILEDEQDEDEDTTIRRWIDSLEVGLWVGGDDLFENLKSGVVLLSVMDRVQPGVVKWEQVNMKPTNLFLMIENGNYAIKIAKVMELAVTTAAGIDIVNGNRLLVMSILTQLLYNTTGNRFPAGQKGGSIRGRWKP